MNILSLFSRLAAASVICPLLQAGIVTTTADHGAGSLRDILAAAASGEAISFAAALDGTTITLTDGPLDVVGSVVTIDASALPHGLSISGNHSSRVLTVSAEASITLRNLHFINGSSSTSQGGGISISNSTLTMEDCSITNCASTYDGGGLYANAATGMVVRSHITGNQSALFGGGVFLSNVADLTFASCSISGNKSGGIGNLGASPILINCTIQGNSGGGVQNQPYGRPVFRNTIVWGNSGIGSNLASRQIANTHETSTADIATSLVQGAASSASFTNPTRVTWGLGNLDGTNSTNAPKFVLATDATDAPTTAADLRIRAGSTSIDAGNNAHSNGLTDLAQRARIAGPTVDLGAYEGGYVSFNGLHPGLAPVGDANGNGLTNFLEYALGADPESPTTPLGTPTITFSGGTLGLTATWRSNALDVFPTWETSTTLAPSSWQQLLPGIDYSLVSTSSAPGDRQSVSITLQPTGPKRFFRLAFSSSEDP